MRKIIAPTRSDEAVSDESIWLDLSQIAQVEVTSEDSDHPIEGVFAVKDGTFWRAAAPGKQSIRLVFDEPQNIRRLYLRFEEAECMRMQEFSVSWSRSSKERVREILRQQWNFSRGAMIEVEDYEVVLNEVGVLELNIDPDRGAGGAYATLSSWRIAR